MNALFSGYSFYGWVCWVGMPHETYSSIPPHVEHEARCSIVLLLLAMLSNAKNNSLKFVMGYDRISSEIYLEWIAYGSHTSFAPYLIPIHILDGFMTDLI
jgi:hypothetical protein